MLFEDCILEFKLSIFLLNGFLESFIISLKKFVFPRSSSWLNKENSFSKVNICFTISSTSFKSFFDLLPTKTFKMEFIKLIIFYFLSNLSKKKASNETFIKVFYY